MNMKSDKGIERSERVNIYGTLGPSCSDIETLKIMIAEGMNGIRLNLSHCMLDDASMLVEAYRNAAFSLGVQPQLLIDMQGPELRIGSLDAHIALIAGELIPLSAIPFPPESIGALKGAMKGTEILLDDGKLLLVLEKCGILRVIRGGLLESRKSIALSGIVIDTPAMTEADKLNIYRAKAYGVTGVMQPFVRGKSDLIEVRRALNCAGSGEVRLLAKVENADGINALDEIIPCCDEIVIARGDLGNSMNLWELPAAQKRIAAACRERGRDFMVVTQMLDSMMHRSVPTRAEVSDIFNAVLDGASSVMVTGETASGEYPVESVRYLAKTVREAELFFKEVPKTRG